VEQLALLDPATSTPDAASPGPHDKPWELDDRTRAVGRHGLEQARRALALARSSEREAA
jgi:hypothetical protein